jgi:hypothetical protein
MVERCQFLEGYLGLAFILPIKAIVTGYSALVTAIGRHLRVILH